MKPHIFPSPIVCLVGANNLVLTTGKELRLRDGGNSGMMYKTGLDGPSIYGYAGGELATRDNSVVSSRLKWDRAGVTVNGKLTVGNRDVLAEIDALKAELASTIKSGVSVNIKGFENKGGEGFRYLRRDQYNVNLTGQETWANQGDQKFVFYNAP